MNPLVAARLRIAVLLVLAILIETSFGSDLRVFQVAPDLMIVTAICAGLAGGAEAGAWVGFWAGLLADVFLTTPIGLSAFTYCLVGAAVGALRASFLQDRRALLPFAGFVGTFAGILLFVTAGDVLGQSQLVGGGRAWLIRVLLVESLWSALLAMPIGYLYTRVARGSVGVERLGTASSGRLDRVAPLTGPRVGPRVGSRVGPGGGSRSGSRVGSRFAPRGKAGSLP